MIRTLLGLVLACVIAPAQTPVCTVTDAGDGCAPLVVTMIPQGQSGGHDLTLTAYNLHPQAIGAMVWGMESFASNPPAIIPGSLCPLLTNYVWGHRFVTDKDGTHTWSRNWPAWFLGYFYMQMGTIVIDEFGNPDVITTDCKLVQCSAP